jgi:hypothetical protein
MTLLPVMRQDHHGDDLVLILCSRLAPVADIFEDATPDADI